MLDEMYLQQEVQYDGRELTGCDSNLQMYKSILCFMVVSLKQSTPYFIKAIPLTKINYHIVQDGIINCVNMLSRRDFNIRAVVSDNRSMNVSAYKHLKALHPCSMRHNAIANPLNPDKYIYLFFDTVHFVKNNRNNLLATKFFQTPALETTPMDLSINITPGPIYWSIFHRVHEQDLGIEYHVRKASKISYQALQPGNNRQSVPLALSIFEPTTITVIRQYFPEDTTTSSFLYLIHNWWLVVNAKERFNHDVIGSALIANDGKIEFLNMFANWLSDWKDSKQHGLSKQSFDTLISTNRAITDLSADLLNEGYKYILSGRLQTDPLERRFSQYRQMSGSRFLVSLRQVYCLESILKLKTFLSNNIELTSNIASITDGESSILRFS